METARWLDAVEPWLHSVLPRQCAGCGRAGHSWCRSCSSSLRSAEPGLVPPPPGAPGILAVVGEHADLLRAAVLLHKSRSHHAVRADLTALVGRALALVQLVLPALVPRGRQAVGPIVVIPVPPSAPWAWRSPAGELAEGIAAGSSQMQCLRVLRAQGQRAAQKSLDAQRRARNVVGAFAIPSAVQGRGRLAVLVDDVVTTGATLAQASAVVRRAGFVVPAAVAVARTPGPADPGGRG